MTEVAHGSAAATRPEVEDLAQRLLALRSDIDAILAGLDAARAPTAVAETQDAGEPVSPPHVAPAPEPVDDLRLISAIDDALAEDLDSLGIVAFSQIAAWSKRDVARVSEALGLGRRIARENWIEQAAILARGRITAFACTRRGMAPAPICEEGHAGTIDAPAPETEPASPALVADDDRQPAAPAEPPTAALPDSAPDLPVLSLNPYRGLPTVRAQIRRRPPNAAPGGVALAVKLAACITALVLAGLVLVDRDAWGGVPAARQAPLPLQGQVLPGARHAPARAAARGLVATEGLLPAGRP
jgi:predicted flap endonuclease-1-like 5' DNA nuclease